MRERDDGAVVLPVLLGEGARLPAYGSTSAAGADLRASEPLVIGAGARAAVPTGLRVAIPPGHVGLVWPRSGLAVRHGIDTLAGVIDADYRGEVMIALINLGPAAYAVRRGDRIAQMVIQRVYQARLEEVGRLDATDRSTGGFGHTGR